MIKYGILYLGNSGYWRDDLECIFREVNQKTSWKFATIEDALEKLGLLNWSLAASNNSDARGTREFIFQQEIKG